MPAKLIVMIIATLAIANVALGIVLVVRANRRANGEAKKPVPVSTGVTGFVPRFVAPAPRRLVMGEKTATTVAGRIMPATVMRVTRRRARLRVAGSGRTFKVWRPLAA